MTPNVHGWKNTPRRPSCVGRPVRANHANRDGYVPTTGNVDWAVSDAMSDAALAVIHTEAPTAAPAADTASPSPQRAGRGPRTIRQSPTTTEGATKYTMFGLTHQPVPAPSPASSQRTMTGESAFPPASRFPSTHRPTTRPRKTVGW